MITTELFYRPGIHRVLEMDELLWSSSAIPSVYIKNSEGNLPQVKQLKLKPSYFHRSAFYITSFFHLLS